MDTVKYGNSKWLFRIMSFNRKLWTSSELGNVFYYLDIKFRQKCWFCSVSLCFLCCVLVLKRIHLTSCHRMPINIEVIKKIFYFLIFELEEHLYLEKRNIESRHLIWGQVVDVCIQQQKIKNLWHKTRKH